MSDSRWPEPGTRIHRALAQAERTTAEYDRHMKQGNSAVQQKKFLDAAKDFEAALKVKPGDSAATTALTQVKTMLADASPTPTPRQAEFEKSMRDGQTALKGRKFDLAVREFEQALKSRLVKAKAERKASLYHDMYEQIERDERRQKRWGWLIGGWRRAKAELGPVVLLGLVAAGLFAISYAIHRYFR